MDIFVWKWRSWGHINTVFFSRLTFCSTYFFSAFCLFSLECLICLCIASHRFALLKLSKQFTEDSTPFEQRTVLLTNIMLWKVWLTDIVLWNSSLAWGFHTIVKKKTQIYTFPLLNMSAWDYAWFSEWKQNREWPCRPKPSTAFKFGVRETEFPRCMNAIACVQRSFKINVNLWLLWIEEPFYSCRT